jgi:hypothetical protein
MRVQIGEPCRLRFWVRLVQLRTGISGRRALKLGCPWTYLGALFIGVRI